MDTVLTLAAVIAVAGSLWLVWRIISDICEGVSVLLGDK